MPKRKHKPKSTQHSSTQSIQTRMRSEYYKKMVVFLMSITAVLLAAGMWAYSRRKSDEVTLSLDTDNFDYATGPQDYTVGFPISASQQDLLDLGEIAGDAALKLFQDSLLQIKLTIQNELPCLFSFKLLDWLLSRPKMVRIVPVPWQIFQRDYPNTDGVYMPGELSQYQNNEPQIYFSVAPTMKNVDWTLKNEFFMRFVINLIEKKQITLLDVFCHS